MNTAAFWWSFWQLAFAVAGTSFAVIAGIVAIRGFSDLRDLVQFLKREQETHPFSGTGERQ